MISDFREISLKSGGLRAGLYRGFLPSFVIYTLFTTEIEFEPKISSFNKLMFFCKRRATSFILLSKGRNEVDLL